MKFTNLMLNILKAVIFVVLTATSAQAQVNASVVQKIHCGGAVACTLPAVKTGDTLIAVADSSLLPADAQLDTFKRIYMQSWYGNYVDLNYAVNAMGGDTTLTFSTAPANVYFAEYPPATFDQVSAKTMLCCGPSAQVGPVTTSAPNEFLIFWTGFSTSVSTARTASAGFNVEDTGTDLTVQDEVVSPGTYNGTVLQGGNASGSLIAAFILTTPPPPPPAPINLTVSGSALFDDASTILTGPVTVQQEQNPQTFVSAGTVNIDSAGALSGSIAVNPNFADTNGNLVLTFGLSAIPGFISYTLPVAEFQQGSTGVNLNVVVFKAALLPKSVNIALVP